MSEKIAIIKNETKEKANDFCSIITKVFQENNIQYTINEIKKDTTLILVIGGDGTMVRTMKEYQGIPIIGINAGTLGFLTDINENNLLPFLDNLIKGELDFLPETYITLHCDVLRNNKVIYSGMVVNDVVLSRSNALEMVRFDVRVNGKYIKQYNADGFIVSTPLGASAYSLSCGGPFVEPTSKLIELTPIAPHTLVNRSIVVDDTKTIALNIVDSRNNKENTLLCIDGEEPIPLIKGDIVEIKKSKVEIRLLRINNISFIDNLAARMIGV